MSAGTRAGALAALAAFAAGSVVAGPTAAQAPGAGTLEPTRVVNVAVLEDTRPFSYVSRFGYREGFEFELARALCAEVPAECNILPMRPDEVVPAISARVADVAIARLSITDALDRTLDFTEPYYVPSARYVVRADRGDVSDDLEAGRLVVAAVHGTPHADFLTKTRSGPNAVRLYGDAEAMWLDLALGRVDAVLTNVSTARQGFLSTETGADYRFARTFVRDPEVYGRGVGIAVREGADDLLASFEAALARFRGTAEFAELRDRYLDTEMWRGD